MHGMGVFQFGIFGAHDGPSGWWVEILILQVLHKTHCAYNYKPVFWDQKKEGQALAFTVVCSLHIDFSLVYDH
jgi:hypothetical protein